MLITTRYLYNNETVINLHDGSSSRVWNGNMYDRQLKIYKGISNPLRFVIKNQDNKPVRSKTNWAETPDDIRVDKSGKKTKVKHFWSFLVYNYKTETVQSFEITQSTIMKALKALIENPKWGSPMKYDVTINRTGKELLTKYAVVPNPHSPLTPEIEKALADSQIDLEAIFDN